MMNNQSTIASSPLSSASSLSTTTTSLSASSICITATTTNTPITHQVNMASNANANVNVNVNQNCANNNHQHNFNSQASFESNASVGGCTINSEVLKENSMIPPEYYETTADNNASMGDTITPTKTSPLQLRLRSSCGNSISSSPANDDEQQVPVSIDHNSSADAGSSGGSCDNTNHITIDAKNNDANNNDNDSEKCEENKKSNDLLEQINACMYRLHRSYQKWFYLLAFGVYNFFVAFACYKTWHKTPSFCSGVKLLVLLTAIAYVGAIFRFILQPYMIPRFAKWLEVAFLNNNGGIGSRIVIIYQHPLFTSPSPSPSPSSSHSQITVGLLTKWIIILGGIWGYILYIAWHEPVRFYSAAGYVGFILFGWIFSKHRNAIRWNQILCGLTIQTTFGIIVLRTTIGKKIFECIGEKINTFLAYTNAGTEMVFGYLATGSIDGPIGNLTIPLLGDDDNNNGTVTVNVATQLRMPIQAAIFAFDSMPVVIFFSFIISILYYYGIMQTVVKQLGWLLQVTIGTTACESISASGNIFLGMTESPLLVRPFLPLMTKSELHAVLTGGFATIAGSVMAAYISFGISATYLISASVMAAPSALAISKLMYPETEKSQTSAKDIQLAKGQERNAIEAGSNGASSAIKLIANIVANLIAFMAFLAFLDSIIGWIGNLVDVSNLSFKLIMSKLFIPIALMLGIEWNDCERIASLIGIKMVINEFVAYKQLSQLIEINAISKRSETICTFALCSFANFASIGIQVGGLSAMAPERKSDLAQMALRAMIAGSMASFMTACVAGMLY